MTKSEYGLGVDLAERGWLPDFVLRRAIRSRCGTMLDKLNANPVSDAAFADILRAQPVAIETEAANDQHYEVPSTFFDLCLGPNRKYSCCFFEGIVDGNPDLSALTSDVLGKAEAEALRISCERAGLKDGQTILDVGCGWGSLSLWMAEQYPGAQITGVSNSHGQRRHIEAQAKARGLTNLSVITADINSFDPPAELKGSIDRIVSLEALEHMRNYEELFRRFAGWIKDDGRVFVHIFVHKDRPFLYDPDAGAAGVSDWMARYFFTGGQMPSRDLFAQFDRDLTIEEQWDWNGQNYALTSRAWLNLMYQNKAEAMRILRETYGNAEAVRWFNRWRLFYLAVDEFFGLNGGEEWFVSHYLFRKTGT